MIKLCKTIIVCFLMLYNYGANAQTEFFHDIAVSKSYYSTDNNTVYTFTPAWKHIYNNVEWRRWSIVGQYKRYLNMWNIGGGIGLFYTFDKDIKNNLELRPYLLVGLKTPMTSRIMFSQTLKGELRSFFYDQSDSNFSTNRLRYNLNTVIILNENVQKNVKWKFRPEVEWYIQKVANIRERFINSTEYTLTFLKEMKKVEIGIGFRLERFNRNFLVSDPNGQTISVEINF